MKVIIALALICLANFPAYAQKEMMFNNVDQYIEQASGIWIVDAIKRTDQGGIDSGTAYEVKVLQTLKGEDKEGQTITISAVSRGLLPGNRYLFFGFNEMHTAQKEVWMDNGNVSPIHLGFSVTHLQGKSLKEQIVFILSARSAEIDDQIKQLTEEKKVIESGLESQRRLDKPPGH